MSLAERAALEEADPEVAPQGVTFRGIATGSALVIWVNFWITYAEYVVHASRMNISHYPVALFASFLILAAAAALLRRIRSRIRLTPSDMAVVLAMGMVGALFTVLLPGIRLGGRSM